jgi:sulfonate transport system permease protein
VSATTQQATGALEALPTHESRPQRPNRWWAPRNLLRAAIPVGALAIWWAVSESGLVSTVVFPSPTQVLAAFADLIRTGELQEALPVSLARAGIGLAIGLSIGIAFGVANGLWRRSEELFDSSFQIIRLIPFIATVPLFIIWFGIGEEMKIIVIALACVFPAYLNTYAGVRHVDPKLIEAGRVFGLGPLKRISTIVLPAALPSVLVGVRFSMGTSLLALVLAESVNSRSGLGFIIAMAQGAIRVDIITAIILVYALLGVIVDVVMRLLERRLLPWKA